MKIAILFGSWTVGSLLLGLVLGQIFGKFAARRRAEEELFARAEEIGVLADSSGRKALPSPVVDPVGVPGSTSEPELRGAAWLSHWTMQQLGRLQ